MLSPNYEIGIAILFHLLSFQIIAIPFPNGIIIPRTKRSRNVPSWSISKYFYNPGKRYAIVVYLYFLCSY
jgi:hypothetical protein